MALDIVSVAYAATLAIGGIMGYVKAGSTQSLYSGVIFGGLMGYSAYQTSLNPDNCNLALAVSFGVFGLMGYRYYETGKVMPAGMVAIMSALMMMRFATRIFYSLKPLTQ